ncbi:uncharacterized protein LOC119399822 [Rhipicephalus sanguineus]|uniref:uncharacterized protein LOC119399822 n=1 Tax=Rhipicephalus sanguineus TaxID=34632 RepID=UPI00189430A2|nr:uncharacterized protein LOC119399822 [Rhipicephalus sanguineus]
MMRTPDTLIQRRKALGFLILVVLNEGPCFTLISAGTNEGDSSTSCSADGNKVTGTVMSVVCNRASVVKVKEEEVPAEMCRERFRWHVLNSWCSPVELLYNVTVPMIRKPRARKTTKVMVNFTTGGWK